MAKKNKKYPNPAFFKAKDNMDLKAQLENLKEVGGIIAGMAREADYKAFFRRQWECIKDDGRRVAREVKDICTMTCEERKDLLLNGEKRLGDLYRKGDMVTVRREWRGLESTAIDFAGWLKMWGMLLGTFSKDLVPALNTTLYYRWMISYIC